MNRMNKLIEKDLTTKNNPGCEFISTRFYDLGNRKTNDTVSFRRFARTRERKLHFLNFFRDL